MEDAATQETAPVAADLPAPDDDAAVTPALATAEPTGVAAVDAALERLRDLDSVPVEAHVEVFDDVQRRLHDALAELDDGQ